MCRIPGVILALVTEDERCGESEDQRGRGEDLKPTAAVYGVGCGVAAGTPLGSLRGRGDERQAVGGGCGRCRRRGDRCGSGCHCSSPRSNDRRRARTWAVAILHKHLAVPRGGGMSAPFGAPVGILRTRDIAALAE